MADERTVYRSPARAQKAASAGNPRQGGQPPRTPKQAPRRGSTKRRSRAILGICAACLVLAVGIAVVCAGIVAAVLISRQLQNTQAQTRKQKDEKSAYHRKKGGK